MTLIPATTANTEANTTTTYSNLLLLTVLVYCMTKLSASSLHLTERWFEAIHVSQLTCSPTLIFFVNAPSGKEAWTNGTLRLCRVPPSGPIWLVSCLMRDTTAKYCGKSLVMMRQILFLSNSSGLSSSREKKNIVLLLCNQSMFCLFSITLLQFYFALYNLLYLL